MGEGREGRARREGGREGEKSEREREREREREGNLRKEAMMSAVCLKGIYRPARF